MGKTVILCLDKDRKRIRQRAFIAMGKRVAREHGVSDKDLHFIHTGESAIALAERYGSREVEHLIVISHGGPDWLIDSRVGITTAKKAKRKGQVTVRELVGAWAPKCTVTLLVSLCACLCSRSPRWWMISFLGQFFSGWEARGYKRGGEASFSAHLRDMFYWHSVFAIVRGHRTAGHALYNAILAEHRWTSGRKCIPLFELVFGALQQPSRAMRRWWTRNVTGNLAERWLLFQDTVVEEIRSLPR